MHPLARLRQAAEVHWDRTMLQEGFPLEELGATITSDVAHWTLLNPDRSLNERIELNRCPVIPTPIDEIALFILHKYLLGPSNSPAMTFMVSTEAGGFSLLLGFYVLLQALLSRAMTITTDMNFPPDSGVLLVSANQELTSRILRTHYGEKYLGEIYQILRVRVDGSVDPLDKNFKSAPDALWFATFSAVRRNLPNTLSIHPKLIIIDLMPLRHRRRVRQLLAWAKGVAPEAHIVVVAPEGDLELFELLEISGVQVCHLGATDRERLAAIMGRSGASEVNPLTAAWGHGIMPTWYSNTTLHYLTGIDEFEVQFKVIQDLVGTTKHERYGIPFALRRLQWLACDLRDLAAPLSIYQLAARCEPSLQEVIRRLGRSVPTNDWERRVFETTLPMVVERLMDIYDWLLRRRLPPKATSLMRILDEVLSDPAVTVLVLMPNRVAALAVATWLDFEMSNSPDQLRRIQIHSIQEYLHSKLLALTESPTPDHVIIGAPLSRRYISLLFGHLGKNIHFLVYNQERRLVKGTLDQFHRFKTRWQSGWEKTLSSVYGRQVSVSEETQTPTGRIEFLERVHRFAGGFESESASIDLVNEDELDMQALYRIWKEVEAAEEEDQEDLEARPVVDRAIYVNGTGNTKAVCVELHEGARLLVPVDQESQFYSKERGELGWWFPDQICSGDAFVSVKSDAARDLFAEILQGLGRTPVMMALQGYMEQWHQILRNLLSRYQDKHDAHQQVFHLIRQHGGNIGIQSVRNWLHGRTVYLRDKRNVLAVCHAANVKDPKRMAEMIHESMSRLWNFHRQLGRKLGFLIRRQISRVLDPGAPIDDIVEAPGGVRLSLADLAEALEVHEVASVTLGVKWEVPKSILGFVISLPEWDSLLSADLIKED